MSIQTKPEQIVWEVWKLDIQKEDVFRHRIAGRGEDELWVDAHVSHETGETTFTVLCLPFKSIPIDEDTRQRLHRALAGEDLNPVALKSVWRRNKNRELA